MLIDPKAGANLLQRMTEEPGELQFDDSQVTALLEVFIPRFVTSCPGMAGVGLKCKVTRDDAGWDIRIDR